jgi:Methyltransferase domain
MRLIDRLIYTCLRALPNKVGRRVMWLLRNSPEVADRWGYHVREIHYYEPLPDFREVTAEKIGQRNEMRGIDLRVDAQLQLVDDLAAAYGEELSALQKERGASAFDFANDYFSHYDAAVYYAVLRHLRPKRVLEVGAGYSTRIAAKALEKNAQSGNQASLVVIEPYPQPRLLDAKLDMRLIKKPVQSIDDAEFAALEEGDVLFIDSSHAVKFGSDVNHLFLNVLPLIARGVWVQVHDIFFPFDYPQEWLIGRRLAFNEQYLLQAFLSGNSSWRVELCNQLLAADHRTKLRSLFESSAAVASSPASFWLQRV